MIANSVCQTQKYKLVLVKLQIGKYGNYGKYHGFDTFDLLVVDGCFVSLLEPFGGADVLLLDFLL